MNLIQIKVHTNNDTTLNPLHIIAIEKRNSLADCSFKYKIYICSQISDDSGYYTLEFRDKEERDVEYERLISEWAYLLK